MSRTIPVLLIVALVGPGLGCVPESSASDPTCEELKQQVSDLTQRVEALERQLAAKPTGAPRPAKTATTGEIDPIYNKIDWLLAQGKIDEAQALFAERKATGERSPTINTLTREMGVVGEPAPQIWAIEKWFQGESAVDLDSGQTTLLLFWESWCKYCRAELPRIQKTHEKLSSAGLQVVGLTRLTKTATEESVREAIEESGVGFPVAKESGELAQYFHVKGIPAAAVIKDGKIIWRGHPLRLTDNLLRSWL